jgi:hypothetical protein
MRVVYANAVREKDIGKRTRNAARSTHRRALQRSDRLPS